jgi:hypothetical protein
MMHYVGYIGNDVKEVPGKMKRHAGILSGFSKRAAIHIDRPEWGIA